MLSEKADGKMAKASMMGGKRKGAGRPRLPPHEVKKPVTVRLPQWMIEQLDELGTRAEIIEAALDAYFEKGVSDA